MKYIIVSAVVTDSITFPGQKDPVVVGGGAGLYAYAGARIWSDDVLLVTGIGEDYLRIHHDWFERNSVNTSGLMIRDAHSPITEITYFENGEREEKPVYGLSHFNKLETKPEDLELWCLDCEGMYVFKNLEDLSFWERIIALKERDGFTLMWEIAADAAIPEKLPMFEQVLVRVDILSINMSECSALFGTDNEEEHISRFLQYRVPCVFYRRGKRGALVIANGEAVSIPSIDSFTRVDPTGAGNSSSAAVLVGYCQKRDFRRIGLMGSISAGFMITQYGPLDFIGDEVKHEAEKILISEMTRNET